MRTDCLFVSDLHGHTDRYEKLFDAIRTRRPEAVFMGGDLLPAGIMGLHAGAGVQTDFAGDYLATELGKLRATLGDQYPDIFAILGNDDGRLAERTMLDLDRQGLWHYVHGRRYRYRQWQIFGYANVPPTPFMLKDWERYDVSRYVDPGCVSPELGTHTVPVNKHDVQWSTIAEDLENLAGEHDLEYGVLLFHSPPYRTKLDRAALDGQIVDHVPLDVHIGSIAIRRFIEARQPLLTMHGHVHESARLTGAWRDEIGRTQCLNAAHDGAELSVISFSLEQPERAERELM